MDTSFYLYSIPNRCTKTHVLSALFHMYNFCKNMSVQ